VRKTRFLDVARSFNLDPSSTLANWRMLELELMELLDRVIGPLRATQSVEDATLSFMNTFEMPENPEAQSRIDFARRILARLT
jgi:hypothetical protein